MIGLIQRVSNAQVDVEQQTIGQINQGIMVLVGVEKGDTEEKAKKLAQKLINYRIFGDENDHMNLSVSQIKGGILLVPQFTLAADTKKGLRPSFSSAASPSDAKLMFDKLVQLTKSEYSDVESGQFGANMQVSLTNDGPVTFWIEA